MFLLICFCVYDSHSGGCVSGSVGNNGGGDCRGCGRFRCCLTFCLFKNIRK